MSNLKKKTATGFAYKFAERVGAQGIGFCVQLLLARLLMPEDYGVVALVTVFIVLLPIVWIMRLRSGHWRHIRVATD